DDLAHFDGDILSQCGHFMPTLAYGYSIR
ncbi:hypothetical protein pdam_00002071, partial [Pocillopora damicornis]